MVPPGGFSQGTTCCVAATKALQHLDDHLGTITAIFSAYQIPSSNYRLCAGFDEDLIRGGLGHLEQIHVLLHSEPRRIKSMLRKLESIFSPFSAIIFTKGAVYRIPSTRIFGMIVEDNKSDLLITRMSGFRRYPTAVSLSPITNSTCTELNGQQSSSNQFPEGAPFDSNHVDGGREPDSPDGESSGGAANPVEISFLATSDLCPLPMQSQPLLQEPRSYQTLTTKGTIVITRTPESHRPRRFATCQVLFTELEAETFQSAGNSAYGHFHTTVIIDSQQVLARIECVKPQISRISLANENPWILSGAVRGIFLQPQGTIQMPIYRTGLDTTIKVTGIDRMDGFVAWCYEVDRILNLKMPADKLPQAHFEFLGATDIPAPPPDRVDVEVSTYWSILPRTGGTENSPWNWPSSFWSNKPSYSNIYQIIALKIPSDVPRDRYDLQARLTVFPRQPILRKTGSMSHDGPTNMTSAVVDSKSDCETASSVYDVKWMGIILELTSFRKVRFPTMLDTENVK